MKKFAAIAIVTSAFCMTGESTEGQIFRRFRENVRGAVTESRPQQYTPRPVQQVPQQRYVPQPNVQPQRQVQQVIVPSQTRGNAVTQQLTPYARLTPAQRNAVPTTASNAPSITAPRPIVPRGASPVNVNATANKTRIVTYLDPRTGRTFQRRYIVPNNAPAPQNIPAQASIAGQQNQPNVNQPIYTGVVPTGNAPQTASVIPPLNLAPVATPPVLNNSTNEALPELAGPTLAAPTQENAIPASVNDSSTVETASAQVPDLSMETAETDPESTPEAQDDFFADTDLSEVDLDEVDDESEVKSYSVLEASDE